MHRLLPLVVLGVLLPLATILAAPPQLIRYQARLTDDAGLPLAGTHDLLFAIYDAETNGSQLWAEGPRSLNLDNGILDILLGEVTPLPSSVFGDSERWLEVTVDAAILAPRQRIASTPYAHASDTLGGKQASEFIDTSSTPQTKTGPLAVNTSTASYGIDGRGGEGGGYFEDSDGTSSAKVAWSTVGIWAEGSGAGGSFNTVGIGTSSPSVELEVVGDVKASGNLEVVGVIESTSGGVRFPDGSVQTSSAGFVNFVTRLDGGGQYNSIAIGADGMPIISYYISSTGDLRAATCDNVLCSSASLNTLDTVANLGQYTSIAIRSDGNPVISFFDVTNGDLRVTRCDVAHCRSRSSITVDDGSGDEVGRFTSIAIGNDDLPVIAYYDATNGDLKVAHCDDTDCDSATVNPIDTGGDVGEHTSIAIGTDGKPVISYWDSTNRDLKVAHCDDAACSTASSVAIDTGNAGQYTSIAIGADGMPIISYNYYQGYNLKVAHCGDALCTTGTFNTVDSTGNVGGYTSIAIGHDDLPVISYYDTTNDDLKVAHCDDAICSSATVRTLDSVGDVGQYTSIAIGTDGKPVISYYDATSGKLKLMTQVTLTP